MKSNPYLKRAILLVVEDQLKDNNPKETRETFERLLGAGYDEQSAKERIGAIVAEFVYDILKNGEKFDRERYINKLSELK